MSELSVSCPTVATSDAVFLGNPLSATVVTDLRCYISPAPNGTSGYSSNATRLGPSMACFAPSSCFSPARVAESCTILSP
jgi:hypothetical protein